MRLEKKLILLLLLLLVLTGNAFSQRVSLNNPLRQPLYVDHITLREGLSHLYINDILQDKQGFMWFATRDGLNKYDGYKMMVYRRDNQKQNTLSDNVVRTILEDYNGDIWVGTYGGGLNKLSPSTGKITKYQYNPNRANTFKENLTRVIYEDHRKDLWIGTEQGLFHYLRKQNKFVHYQQRGDRSSLSNNLVRTIFEDQAKNIWIGTRNGLNRLDRATNKFTRHYVLPHKIKRLKENDIRTITEDSKGTYWLGTQKGLYHFIPDKEKMVSADQIFDIPKLRGLRVESLYLDKKKVLWAGTINGLYKFDQKSKKVTGYKHFPWLRAGLRSDIITSIFEDRTGSLWLGSHGGGIGKYDPDLVKFPLMKKVPRAQNRLNNNDITAVFEDSRGILWIGTNGGGLNRYDPKTKKFSHYLYSPKDLREIKGALVSEICEDNEGNIWVGTYRNGLYRIDPNTFEFKRILHKANDPNSISGNNITSLKKDSQGLIWIGTFRKGLNRFDPTTKTFTRFEHNPKDSESLSGQSVKSIHEDKKGNIWVGTFAAGLNRFDPVKEKFTHYKHNPEDKNSLSSNTINSIYSSSNGVLWVGTSSGLNKLPPNTLSISVEKIRDLPNDAIQGILEDQKGRLWLSTYNGLVRYNPKTENIKIYNESDGLQGKQFRTGVAFQNRSGTLFFGGPEGLNIINPMKVKDNKNIPPVVFSDFQLFNKSVVINGPNSPLKQHINNIQQLTLSHTQSVFSFEFSALNYRAPQKNRYAYKMDGFEKDWNYVDSSRRFATYTSLPAGDYIFRVKASNNDGVWNEQGKAIRITILSPWWKTWWAYTFYLLCCIGLVFLYVQLRTRRQTRELASQRLLNEELQKVDQLKDDFLANTSHELRTPLHGIIGLTESLIDGVAGKLPRQVQHNLEMITASGKRLSNLVDDLLDISKLKRNKLDLNFQYVDIGNIIDIVFTISRPMLKGKNVELLNKLSHDTPLVPADKNRLQQILFNLIGNAIKFTEQGTITISTEVIPGSDASKNMLAVSVRDTGIGIPKVKQNRIFDHFEQVENSSARSRGGTGLGLPITKELVHLHGGTIIVDSELNVGSTFTVFLPIQRRDGVMIKTSLNKAENDKANRMELVSKEVSIPVPYMLERSEDWPHILVVDDEPVNQQVVSNYLSMQRYGITCCSDGLSALDFVRAQGKPDLILLDVMMPHLSGYDVCKQLREEYGPDELPIIMLTAKSQVNDLIHGFNAGANDYLRKPFQKDELLIRIKNQLQLKEAVETYRESERLRSEIREQHIRSEEQLRYRSEIEKTNRELMKTLQTLKETQDQLIESEKMAALGDLVAGVAHEINTPLGNGIMASSHLQDQNKKIRELYEHGKMSKKNFEDYIYLGNEMGERVQINLQRASELIQNFMKVAVDQSHFVKEVFGIKSYLQMVINSLQPSLKKLKPEIEITCDETIELNSYPGAFSQIVTNLVNNSLLHGFATDSKNVITLQFEELETGVLFRYADNGKGISEENLKKIFTPFFTTKRARGGTGLGLHIVYNLIRQKIGGTITCESTVGKGVEFRIFFPRTPFESSIGCLVTQPKPELMEM